MQFGKKVLFFTVAGIATAAELVQIAALRQSYETVLVRNGDVNINSKYSARGEAGRLEPADAVAGTVPAAYTTGIANYADGNVTPQASDAYPEAIFMVPVAPSIAAAGGTVQLNAVAAEADDNGGVTQTLRNSGTGVSWSSGTPAKATVSAAGLVTGAGAGAGSTIITYTYDAGVDADPVVKTVTVTVT